MSTPKLAAALRWLSLGALVIGLAVHFFTDYALGGASPLALLLTGLGGWLLQPKVVLVGSLLLLFAGGALLLFPFLNVASLVYSLLGVPQLALGLLGALQWWKEEA